MGVQYPLGFPVKSPSGSQFISNRLQSTLSRTASFDRFITFCLHSNTMFKSNSLAQIAADDTPIGERPYPSPPQVIIPHVRAYPVAPKEATPALSDVTPESPGSWEITGSPRDPPSPPIEIKNSQFPLPHPQLIISDRFGELHIGITKPFGERDASSEIEIISSNLPPKRRIVSRDVKPSMPPTGTRGLVVSFTLYLPKGHDLSKGPPKKSSKPVYQPIPLPVTTQTFQIDNHSLPALKEFLFDLASKVDNDTSHGNTAILKLADTGKKVKIFAFIARHHFYAKDHNRLITSDEVLKSFYSALPHNPVGNCGFSVTMENPTKAAQAASAELTKSQGRMRAQHTLASGTTTTTSDVAHSAPIAPEKQYLTALQNRHGSLRTNKGDGWQIFNTKDLTQKMELTTAKETPDVTIDVPPIKVYPQDFIWLDVLQKRPTSTACTTPMSTTPIASVKRVKVEEGLIFPLGSYAEMQGHSINIDYKTIRRIHWCATMKEYLQWCDIEESNIDHDVKILLTHGIQSFRRFLFPDVLEAKTIASWGILWDTAMELIARAREFYVYQVALEQQKLNSQRIYDDDMELLRQSELRNNPVSH
ncbi:uncharacterized protein MELLADRAFT_68036 [Melampsora larici-populina 98AG31]|uniref:Uncharacterized protein n=1 Tax=Melampsora larici-populina (strain 98AG31 / pathotype 3-4-7) TaxID=747676 RepID=F4S5C3_MELLP|nr:uncharacterized protein MELLADRAFT_68036 [Melampsora larici-populina 98AG31]EGG00184.1 hypothetical protein MELLADRAFT_68036 [Melampsora larici-populina 98AG31]